MAAESRIQRRRLLRVNLSLISHSEVLIMLATAVLRIDSCKLKL